MARVGDFKDRHKGGQIVVAGNGRSLNQIDLDRIVCPSFGVNGIFRHQTWHPTYYCIESKKSANSNRDEILRYAGPRFKFVANRCRQHLGTKKLGGWHVQALRNFVWVNLPSKHSPIGFSTDCRKIVYHGMNVIYMCLQLAFYMGARQVVLIGVDFDYPEGPVAADHFYDNVLQAGHPMDSSHKKVAIDHFQHAHDLFNTGPEPRIVNASPGTKLDVFPKVQLEDLL